MSQYLLFFILGLSVGAVYAALTLGIVVVYQGTGVINFACAAMATVPLYFYYDLRHGLVTLPLPWLPKWEIDPMVTWLAIVLALVVAAGVGALIQTLVARPLRTAPVLAKVVAAVGVMMTLQAAMGLKYGTEAKALTPILPHDSVEIAGVKVGVDRLWITGIVVVLGAALALWFRHSRAGLAVRAAAENERAASFARLSPNSLGMLTWVLSSVFVAFVIIISGPAIGVLTPSNLTLLVVPALAAALLARLDSLWVALAGALGLGVLQSELQFLSQTKSWWPDWAKQGLLDAVPFTVIVIALYTLGRSIPTRGDDVRTSLPPVVLPRNKPGVVGFWVVAALLAVVLTSGSYRFGVITSLILALVSLSLVVLTGMVGQISLAQAAFAGVAGLFVSKLGTSVPFPFSLALGGLVAMVAGVLVGLPALRLRGAQLAVVTLAAGLTLEKFVFANPKFLDTTADLIPDPHLFGLDLAVRSGRNIARVEFGVMVLVIVSVCFVLVGNLMRAGTGRKMLAVRSNERAAASIGVSVAGVKLGAFALSSFLAGIGGALIGYSRGLVSSGSFGVFVGLSFLATAYVGGITSASGAVVAGSSGVLGIVFVIMDRNLHFGNYYGLISGLALIFTVIFNPVGIAGKARADLDNLRARRRAHKSATSGTLAEPSPVSAPTPSGPREVGDVVLRATNITVVYGGLIAVDDVSIEVRAGEIVGLIGPNGAGKTSFIDAITGFTPCTGEVLLGDEVLTSRPPHQRARRGLVRTWQSVELFDDLSVANNVRVADDIRDDPTKVIRDMIRPNPAPSEEVLNAIRLLSLHDVADRRPSELSLGRQKSLGVARSLALAPKALLLDEPAAGLDTRESLAFGEQLKNIAATGVGCLLVDHDMHLVLGVCDRIYVIEFGSQIAEGPPDVVRRNPNVLRAYLGTEHIAGINDEDSEADAAEGVHA